MLQYCNELSMTIELDSTLAQAEVLYLSFAQLVADIDRRNAEDASKDTDGRTLRKRNVAARQDTAQSSNQAQNAPAAEATSRAVLSEDLRELLKAGR